MGRSRAALPRPSVGRAERSLSRPLQAALDRDVFEDDDVSRGRRKHALHGENEEEAGSEYGEMEGSDEEVTSDEDGDEVGGRRGARDDLESLGSSVDPDEVTDLSRMLSDDEDDSGVSDGDAYSSAAANAGMLQAVGLRASRSRQNRERTEGLEESEQAVPDAPHLSVDDLLGSLGEQDSVSLLRRDLRGVAKGGARRSAHAQLAAPVEQATKRRLERQAAAEAAHRIVSGWEQAVHRSTTAETLRFPQDRQQSYGSTLGTLAAAGSGGGFKNSLEEGVDRLLEEHGLSERAAAEAEMEALRDLDTAGGTTPAEAEARLSEMKKMRDLLFYHEVKAKRIAKIKSRSYRKVHKKASRSRDEQMESAGALDKHAAARLQMKKEVERVRERMTLKHKNTTRWAKHALKHQKHNPALATAVTEQLVKGEQLRRKQMDATAGGSQGEEGDSDSEGLSDGSGDEAGDAAAGGGGQSRDAKLLWRLQNEEEPVMPEKGLFSMAFMRRAAEKRKREAEAMLAEMASPAVLNTGGADAGRPGAPGTAGDDTDGGSGGEEGEDGPEAARQRPPAARRGLAGRRKLAHTPSQAGGAQALHTGPAPSGADCAPVPADGRLRVSRSAAPIFISQGAGDATGAAAAGRGGEETDQPGRAAAPARKISRKKAAAQAGDAGALHSATPSPAVSVPPPAPLVLSSARGGKPVALVAPLVIPRAGAASGAGALGSGPGAAGSRDAAANGKPNVPQRRTKSRGNSAAAEAAEIEADLSTPGDELTAGASLLLPSAVQQSLVEAAFPESAELEFASEKQALVEAEAGVAADPMIPGWGDWSGLGARVGRRQEERKRTAAEAREEQLAQAAARRQDAALRHVILSEKRDKKAAKFTVAAVPFPFKTRDQFERSMRNPLGAEWNTVHSHSQLVQPRVATVRGALIQPVSEKKRVEASAGWRGKRRT